MTTKSDGLFHNRASALTAQVKNAVVIKFTAGARYRAAELDFTNGDTFPLLGIAPMSNGGSEGGLRATIPHREQPDGKCSVRIDGREFEVIVDYTGPVCAGIEKIPI